LEPEKLRVWKTGRLGCMQRPDRALIFDSARKTLDAAPGFVKYPAIHPAGGVILFL